MLITIDISYAGHTSKNTWILCIIQYDIIMLSSFPGRWRIYSKFKNNTKINVIYPQLCELNFALSLVKFQVAQQW